MKTLYGPLLAAVTAAAGRAGEIGTLDFSLRNDRDTACDAVVRVSLPAPAGLIPGEPHVVVRCGDRRFAAQPHPITRHPDGSVRRMMLSFPVPIEAKASLDFACEPAVGGGDDAGPALAETGDHAASIRTDVWRLKVGADGVRLLGKNDATLASIHPFGPSLTEPQPPTLTVIENGPFFVWLRWRQTGADYTREWDLQADKLGWMRLDQRLLRHLAGNGWTPDFGWEVSAAGAEPVRLPERPVGFLALPVAEPLGKHAELVAAVRLADGTPLAMANPLALRQHRGSIEAIGEGDTTTVRFSRLEPVAKEQDNLQIQEGMWRTLTVMLGPGSPESLTAAADAPVTARVDWRLFDAVYHTGPPLVVQNAVLKALAEEYVATLSAMPIQGDDLGSLGGLERYNHCQYIWEDYFRGGDPRLRRIALDYSENYHDFSIYWGPKPEFYGGGRYPADARTQPWPGSFRTRHNDAVTFCTKGNHGFWLAYEETGDPRFRYAAEQQAKWSAEHVHATVNYTRCIGQVNDFVKLYEYTGDKAYLVQAERLWSEFQACQNPDLLFNEAGVPSTGNDLYVPDDQFGYQHPYVKSYIVQYATNALPYLLKHRPDDRRLHDTIVACNDWMARVQTAGGGWSYPGPTTAGFQWNIEYCHGLMLGHEIEPKPVYLDAVERDLRALAALFQEHHAIAGRVTPWEYLAGKTAADLGQMYHLGTDRDRSRDFTDGRIEFGVGPDHAVYFQVLLREYLRHRPEDALFVRGEPLDRILRMPTSRTAAK